MVGVAVILLGVTLAKGWSPKLGLDLDGGLSVVYQTHTPVNSAELDTIVTILNERVGNGTSGATVEQPGKEPDRGLGSRGQELPADPRKPRQHRPAVLPARPLLREQSPGAQGSEALDRAPPDHLCSDLAAHSSEPRGQHEYEPGYQDAASRSAVHDLPDDQSGQRQGTLDRPPAGNRGRGDQRALRPRPGRPLGHRGEIGDCPGQQRAVGGQHRAHLCRGARHGTHWPNSSSTPSSASISTAR